MMRSYPELAPVSGRCCQRLRTIRHYSLSLVSTAWYGSARLTFGTRYLSWYLFPLQIVPPQSRQDPQITVIAMPHETAMTSSSTWLFGCLSQRGGKLCFRKGWRQQGQRQFGKSYTRVQTTLLLHISQVMILSNQSVFCSVLTQLSLLETLTEMILKKKSTRYYPQLSPMGKTK